MPASCRKKIAGAQKSVLKTAASCLLVMVLTDAPVLAADVEPPRSGADAAIESADVVFMNSQMRALPRASVNSALYHAGTEMSGTPDDCFIVFVLGLTGIYANMWLAVFGDTGVAILYLKSLSGSYIIRRPLRYLSQAWAGVKRRQVS